MNEAPQKDKGPRTNDDIRAAKVLLIDENGEKQGVMPISAALDAAREAGMDLVEVSPNQEVPVVKILDYGKLRFEERKKKAAAKKKQKNSELKFGETSTRSMLASRAASRAAASGITPCFSPCSSINRTFAALMSSYRKFCRVRFSLNMPATTGIFRHPENSHKGDRL